MNMCGILALYLKAGTNTPSKSICSQMLDTLKSRGPDEINMVDMGSAILGHTRLSIIDLATGSQPIFNEDKTIAVILNGEIYNFIELRKEAEKRGHIFYTNSDAEVIVHLYEDYGSKVFTQLNGMFSIVIYDSNSNTLLVARDRTGEKPLLYWESPEIIIVASELKAIIKYPGVPKELDFDALALYFKSLYIPTPYTIFKNVKKLLPAHFMKVTNGRIAIRKYWNPVLRCKRNMQTKEAVEEFTELFSDAVKKRMVSDVPLGVFLSGGIDSSAVTAFASRNSAIPIKTFSVGFADEIDERPYARLVAKEYKTEHTEILIESKITDVIEKVADYFDEPFADSSCIPMYLISREARKHLKVILTGDGGDELFAGYSSYLDQKYQTNSRIVTKLFKTLNQFSIAFIKEGLLEGFYPSKSSPKTLRHWLNVRQYLSDSEIKQFICHQFESPDMFFEKNIWLNLSDTDALSRSYAHDMNFYLPDDLLKKVDMASMLCGLECRAPFLDHRLIEYSFSIPSEMKLKNDSLKYILKKSLVDYLPSSILNRKKTGFGAPIGSWLRKELKSFVSDALAPGCKIERIIHRDAIINTLSDVYKSNTSDYRTLYKLWMLFILELWMRKY